MDTSDLVLWFQGLVDFEESALDGNVFDHKTGEIEIGLYKLEDIMIWEHQLRNQSQYDVFSITTNETHIRAARPLKLCTQIADESSAKNILGCNQSQPSCELASHEMRGPLEGVLIWLERVVPRDQTLCRDSCNASRSFYDRRNHLRTRLNQN